MHAEDFRASRRDHEPFIHQQLIVYDVEETEPLHAFDSHDRYPIPSKGDKVDFEKMELHLSDDGGHAVLDEQTVPLPEGDSTTYEVEDVRYRYTRVETDEEVEFVYQPGFALCVFLGVRELSEEEGSV